MKGKKKQNKKDNASKPRVLVGFNTGTRKHKSKKDYDRKKSKKDLQKQLKEW